MLCRREWAQQKGIAVLGVLRGYADAAKVRIQMKMFEGNK